MALLYFLVNQIVSIARSSAYTSYYTYNACNHHGEVYNVLICTHIDTELSCLMQTKKKHKIKRS